MGHGIQRKFFSTIGIVLLCTAAANASAEGQQAILTPVECTSAAGERQHCAANTSSGILMRKSTGPNACLLGKTWGYDDAGVWVQDGKLFYNEKNNFSKSYFYKVLSWITVEN